MRFLDQRCSRVRRGLDRRPADCPPANRIDNCASRSRTVIVETGSFWKGSYRVLESLMECIPGPGRRADAKPLRPSAPAGSIWRLAPPGPPSRGPRCVMRGPPGARRRAGAPWPGAQVEFVRERVGEPGLPVRSLDYYVLEFLEGLRLRSGAAGH